MLKSHHFSLTAAQNRKIVETWLCHLRLFCSSRLPPYAGTDPTTSSGGGTDQHRALRVAVIGSPNVGKSALTNALIRTNVCAVSKQIDTTRRNTMASLTEDMCQLVVVDSPGLIGMGHARKMAGVTSDEPILSGPTRAIERAELILVVHDVTMPGKYLNHRLLYNLHRFSHIPSCLVMNKVDLVTDRAELLQLAHTLTEGIVHGEPMKTERVKVGKIGSIIARNRKASSNKQGSSDAAAAPSPSETSMSIHPSQRQGRDDEWHKHYTQLISRPAHRASWHLTRKLFGEQFGWPNFSDLFFASALRGDGIDALRQHLRSLAQNVDEWGFTPDTISPTDPRMLCAEHTRSALLDRCPGNIAYALRTRITDWETVRGVIRIVVDIFCDKEGWVRIVGRHVGDIEQEQCKRLGQLFNMPVQFRMFICGPDKKRRYGDFEQQRPRSDSNKQDQEDGEDVHMTYEQVVLSGGGRNAKTNRHQQPWSKQRGG